ncbi:ATP-grasp domain-containing protein [Flammeovirga sp. SJP92]|uniref:ATP-grasp domain-containing protein n=1 Tax=Flammeovirga sp. SJP92 TaxID=1775430 RepID=UPI0007885AFD|nr:ATP-grasp domain-containing protein [Flammeovirga sp. SJP92]KXX68977.1 carboxylate--amine ligase [Flammeovirga sp. SJP92]
MKKIAILYQDQPAPAINGITKPMKEGGYSDSGADIAYELSKYGFIVITPQASPNIENDLDWVFPDTEDGILAALNKGANTFWMNTVLYKHHPIHKFFDRNIKLIGQLPSDVELFDDKFYTNDLLKNQNVPIPKEQILSKGSNFHEIEEMQFPMVVKPLRGRGSQGVSKVENISELNTVLDDLFNAKKYGSSVYVEEFLEGQEITITVMPAGEYIIDHKEVEYVRPWCLPAVKRINHKNGIAPYSGEEAVIKNSMVLEDDELYSEAVFKISQLCRRAAEIIEIKAPIRIDCRANKEGKYFIFDINMKPNMTGASRPHRMDQDSLIMLAARKIGWEYIDLLKNIASQSWKVKSKVLA